MLWDWNGTDAASDLALTRSGLTSVSEQPSYRNLTGTTDNIRVFNLQAVTGALFTPNFDLNIISAAAPDGNGHYPISLKNLRIYPPYPADPTGMTPWGITHAGGSWVAANPAPPMYHPQLWNHVGDAQCFRFMNLLGTNNCPLADFADYPPTTNLSRVGPPQASGYSKAIVSNLVSIVPLPAGMDPYFAPAQNTMALVTTATPHGVYDGAGYILINATGPSTTLTGSQGQVVDFSSFAPYNAHPISPTQFIIQCRLSFPNHSTISGTIGPGGGVGGTVTSFRGVAMPLEDMVAFCNTAKSVSGYGGDLWWNVSPAATDACDASVAAYIAAHLGPGQKCYLEYANECGNYSFKTFFLCQHLGYLDGKVANPSLDDDSGAYPTGYAATMLRKHAIYRDTFAAAGRPATDLVRVVAGFGGSAGGASQSVMQQVIAKSAPLAPPVDAYATSTYVDNVWPGAYIADLRYNTMTVEQQLDHWELMIINKYSYDVTVTQHRSMLESLATGAASNLATLPIVNYEAALQIPTAGASVEDGFLVGEEIIRHPRMYRLRLSDMEAKQAAGIVLSVQFYMDEGIFNQYGGTPDPYGQGYLVAWATWFGWNQAAGTGNPSENPNPFAMPNVVSQQGGALNRWSSLIAGSRTIPVNPKPKRLIPGRNGQIRTTGFPRGLFRPSR